MKITNKRSDLRLYFRPEDLYPVSSFISYCKDFGLKISEEELEYYDRNNLLLPAIWVNPGYAKFIKAFDKKKSKQVYIYPESLDEPNFTNPEKQTYYSSGGFNIDRSGDWLQGYIDEGLTFLPHKTTFKDWSSFTKQKHFVKDKSLVENTYIPFYSATQVYHLWFLVNNLQVSFKNDSIFSDKTVWTKRGEEIQNFAYQLANTFISPKSADYYKLASVLAEAKELIHYINKEEFEAYKSEYERSNDPKEAEREAEARVQFLLTSKKKEANSILKKYDLSAEQLANMRLMIMQTGTFSLSMLFKKRRRTYVKSIPERDLCEAEPAYNDTKYLNRLLEACGEKPETVKSLLLETQLDVCEVCGNQFKAIRGNQKVCPSDACQKERNRRYKANKRKSDPSYGR